MVESEMRSETILGGLERKRRNERFDLMADVENRKDDKIDRDINSTCVNFGSLALHPVGFTADI
jgi:hypothetical protein